MLATYSPEIAWVAIDPGDSRYSPQHIESVVFNTALSRGVNIEWLATVPLTDGESRYGFVIGAVGELHKLSLEICEKLGSQAHPASEETINKVLDGVEARFIKFPTSLEKFADHAAVDLIEQSAIDEVVAIGEELPMDAVIATANYLRPTLLEGRVVLLVERIYNGKFAPIEKEFPHQCCGGDHAPF